MVSVQKIKYSRVINAAIFFILAFFQIIIVSWILITRDDPNLGIQITSVKFLGFYVSINPLANLQFTVILVLLTAGLQLLLLAFLVNIVFSNKNMIQIFPEPLYGPSYAPEEAPLVNKTIELVARTSKKANIKVKKIFVYRKAVPNAFSLDLFPLPFFRRPYIVLNTNVLEILTEKEIEAVIAHELAHISHGDSLVRLILSIPRLFLNLAYLFIYLQILTGIQDALFNSFDLIAAIERTIFLGLVYLLLAVVTKITVRFLYSANRQAEYLADYVAAQYIGSDTVINALIHLGQRSEAMQVLSREIEWLQTLSNEKVISSSFISNIYQRFPKTQLNEDVAREIAPQLFLEEKIGALIDNYGIELDPEVQKQLIAKAVPFLLQKRANYFADLEEKDKEFTPSTLKSKTVDWRRFDSDSSQNLELAEIEVFIANLLSHPEKMVFEHELFHQPEKSHDHPTFRERILNIYCIFHLPEFERIKAEVIAQEKSKIKQSKILSSN